MADNPSGDPPRSNPRNRSQTVWPLLEPMQTPDETLANRERVREFSDWIDRADYAEKVLEAAAWLGNDLGLLDSMAGMKSAPSVSDATAAIATHVAPGPMRTR